MLNQKRCVDNNIFVKADDNFHMDVNVDYPMAGQSSHMEASHSMGMMGGMPHMGMNQQMAGCMMQPTYECPQERVCHRVICHEQPHVMPVHTRVINHHVINHSYTPCFTCSEENVCEHVCRPNCCM